MKEFKVRVDARPEAWGDASEFLDAPERGKSPRSRIIENKERDPDELIPEGMRERLHHRELRHVQEVTTAGSVYEVYWVHGQFVEAGMSGKQKRHAHYESWFLIVGDTGHFLDVPANVCTPA